MFGDLGFRFGAGDVETPIRLEDQGAVEREPPHDFGIGAGVREQTFQLGRDALRHRVTRRRS